MSLFRALETRGPREREEELEYIPGSAAGSISKMGENLWLQILGEISKNKCAQSRATTATDCRHAAKD